MQINSLVKLKIEGADENNRPLKVSGSFLVRGYNKRNKRYVLLFVDGDKNPVDFGKIFIVSEREIELVRTEKDDLGYDIRKWPSTVAKALVKAERSSLERSSKSLGDKLPLGDKVHDWERFRVKQRKAMSYLSGEGKVRELRKLYQKRVAPPHIKASKTVQKRRAKRLQDQEGQKKGFRGGENIVQLKHKTLRDFTVFVQKYKKPEIQLGNGPQILERPLGWPEEVQLGFGDNHYLIEQLAFANVPNRNGQGYRVWFKYNVNTLDFCGCQDCAIDRYSTWWAIEEDHFRLDFRLDANGYLPNIGTGTPGFHKPIDWPLRYLHRFGANWEIEALRGYVNRAGVQFREWFANNWERLVRQGIPDVYRMWWDNK